MSRNAQGSMMITVGVVLAYLVVTEAHTWYVRESMWWMLAPTAALLAAVGVWSVWGSDDTEESRSGAQGVGWLLLAPLVVIAAVAPSPLGVHAADLRADQPVREVDVDRYGPMPSDDGGPVDISLTELRDRAYFGPDTVDGVEVQALGFLQQRDEHVRLSRFQIACCAADAVLQQVELEGGEDVDALAAQSDEPWVVVTGVVQPSTGDPDSGDPPVLDVTGLDPVAAPAQPYELLR